MLSDQKIILPLVYQEIIFLKLELNFVCNIYLFRCVVEAGYRLSFQYNASTRQYDVLKTDSDDCHTTQFLQCIVDEISRSRMIANKNLVEASKYCPINGEFYKGIECK